MGMSINALMVSEIITFFKVIVWYCDDVLHFIHVMQGMDEVFIKFHAPEK